MKSIKLLVWGDYALFTRPEMKAERVSYDVITPSAARGVLEAIYWKPQIRWVIDEIHVLSPIRFTNIRRNEISHKVPGRSLKKAQESSGIHVEEHRQQRASLLLKDVKYGIVAHFDVLDPHEKDGTILEHPAAKHLDTFRRRAEAGAYFHHPYLGTREFPADFQLVDSFPDPPAELAGPRPLGYMLHDILFDQDKKTKKVRGAKPKFFNAFMQDGVISVPPVHDPAA